MTPEDGDGPSRVMKRLGQRMSSTLTAPIGVPARSGRDGSAHAWLVRRIIFLVVTGISS